MGINFENAAEPHGKNWNLELEQYQNSVSYSYFSCTISISFPLSMV